MKSHRRFEELAARRQELQPAEEKVLAAHLETCKRCHQLADVYAQQDLALQEMSHGCVGGVRNRVLARVDRMPEAYRPDTQSPLVKASLLRSLVARAALAVIAAGAIAANVPNHATVGAEPSPLRPWTWTSCNAEGYALLNYRQILTSPAQYRGPGVIFLKPALAGARKNIPRPIYYVFPRSPSLSACQPNLHVTDILIAINTRTGTELHAVGLDGSGTP